MGNPMSSNDSHARAWADACASRRAVPTARTWFGYVATWTCALAATEAKSLVAVKMARALVLERPDRDAGKTGFLDR
jgi:hypothetical protein